jgi:hypothetical protein
MCIGEVSSQEVLMQVRCKPNDRDNLKALPAECNTPKRVIEKGAVAGVQQVIDVDSSPSTRAMLDELEKGVLIC